MQSATVRELPFLTITEAARRNGVSRPTVVQAIDAGRLPVYITVSEHDGNPARLVRPEDVDRLWGIRKYPIKPLDDDELKDAVSTAIGVSEESDTPLVDA
ncbi:excisionase family DNA-binding protein [Mycobacterium sp. M1]|uniref:Excisionase family DNA-binding protein n=1 Tax=Mycolicibacter acidiphilus TaxID=2835306 RepID=A0ABS5RLJ3_9MYCO|nr:excisionase family DNA-binding protein [Mycolicibacter acidiphilus]